MALVGLDRPKRDRSGQPNRVLERLQGDPVQVVASNVAAARILLATKASHELQELVRDGLVPLKAVEIGDPSLVTCLLDAANRGLADILTAGTLLIPIRSQNKYRR